MKKELFDLQLFADGDGGNDAGQQNQDGVVAGDNSQQQQQQQPNSKKYDDSELDEIIKRKKAEWKKEQDKKLKEAEKLAQMNAQERAEHERDELQKQLDAYKKKEALSEMSKVARKMLQDENIGVGDDVLTLLVNEDAETTKAAINDFSKAFKAAVEKEVNERLKGKHISKGDNINGGTMTKEQIMAIADPELRQQKMIENRHLFNF